MKLVILTLQVSNRRQTWLVKTTDGKIPQEFIHEVARSMGAVDGTTIGFV